MYKCSILEEYNSSRVKFCSYFKNGIADICYTYPENSYVLIYVLKLGGEYNLILSKLVCEFVWA